MSRQAAADRLVALDTSVAIPLLVSSHTAHRSVVEWWSGRDVALCGHALVETYSVLTRLPGDNRLAPEDAAALMSERFVTVSQATAAPGFDLVRVLSDAGIAGGAVYDAIVALAAMASGMTLATRDARALSTYRAVGAVVDIVE